MDGEKDSDRHEYFEKRLEITRRGFLGGAASTPILIATSGTLYAQEPSDVDSQSDLLFILSEDEQSVIIRRVPPLDENGHPSKRTPYADWKLEAGAFGPSAWFDLDPREKGQEGSTRQVLNSEAGVWRRRLAVRGVSWGKHLRDTRGAPLEIVFVFERTDAGPWTIGLETNVWSSAKNSAVIHTEPENRQPLHSFLADRATVRLNEVLGAARIQSALGPMLDGQVLVSADMTVGLNADIDWVLEPQGNSRPISAFGGCIEAPAANSCDAANNPALFTIGWEQGNGEFPTGHGRCLTARCPAKWSSAFAVASTGPAPSVTITSAELLTDSGAFGELFVGQLDPLSRVVSEAGVDAASVIALFSTQSAILDCEIRTEPEAVFQLCTGLPLDDLTITRISTGTDKWRDVVVADAGGKRTISTFSKAGPPQGQNKGKTSAVDALPWPARINTTIGRMEVGPLPVDTAAIVNQSNEIADGALKARRKFDTVSAAAIGDRAGVSERTFFLLADRSGAAQNGILRRLSADVALYSLDTALPDTRDSNLTVAGSNFRFFYGDGDKLPGLVIPEVGWNTPDGYLWVGRFSAPSEFAWLDLGAATLKARRDHDLVDVSFRFADLVLAFSVGREDDGGFVRTLRPSRPDARQTVVRRDTENRNFSNESDRNLAVDDHILDSRPILAVEFPPQHLMEEAFFRQGPGPLPDTKWPDDEVDLPTFLNILRKEESEEKRTAARKKIGEKKEALDASEHAGSDRPSFALLRKFLLGANLPKDQQQYIGPYAMSSEAIKVAREWQAKQDQEFLRKLVAQMLAEAGKIQPPNPNDPQLQGLLVAEADAEKVYPLYKLWRDAFRAYVIETRGGADDGGQSVSDSTLTEFINRNRSSIASSFAPSQSLEDKFTTAFLLQISGREPYDRLAMARLSGRSLLAFRVNLEAAPGDSAETNDLPDHPRDNAASPGPGVQRFGAMPFTFAALTDWSRHEPHVTQRARKLYEPLASGAMPPVVGRVASVDDHAILALQGFETGAKPSEAHLGQVRANLTKRPQGLETKIEIPSRLILSTAQNAIWQSPRKVRREARTGSESGIFDTDPVALEPDMDFEAYEPLWTARLITEDAEPSLRAVWSPDVRPEAIGFIPAHNDGVPRIAGAPPRGPWAPWILRREQVDGVRLLPLAVQNASAASNATDASVVGAQNPVTDEIVCPEPTAENRFLRNAAPNMFARICEIFRIRAHYNNQPDLHTFRTSLDAYDRHELVLLSSAYGLPVTGRRRQIGNSDTDAGDLIEKSGQFEPGEDFHLTDATSDLAYYRPKPLDVGELSLSALGGFLNHDTNFLPPAPAVTYDGRSLFDGLSIERWQHQIVLGRDVLATVVYSGYLFPIGHKASLVKITERIFVRMKGDGGTDKDFGIKAVLRQRMFVRVSAPSKKFPAVGQPNKGRQWCSEDVTMLTRETPDIVDPTLELNAPASGVSLSGRIFLDDQPGLAFWPQTAMTEQARFCFEFTLDGRRTKMPLIFADRIAVKNKTSLNALLNYYRGLNETEWRTAVLAGQTLRFAEPVKDGETSFATDSLVLTVDGRSSSDGRSWEGQNDLMTNTGVLEGADQPPFYPVMSSANIHIEQAERMSGAAIGATRVRFDGSYVLSGFPVRQTERGDSQQQTEKSPVDNAAEVFFYVDMPTPPKMSMGPNGNQSGGVGRPNMDIVALSRLKGILGAQPGQSIYQYGPSDNPRQRYDARPALLSVAKYFSLPAALPAQAGAGQVGAAAVSDADISAVFESFFSRDAKLLGVISFQSLMRLLKLTGGVDAMPALREVVDYGSEALSQVKKGATGALELLQSEILAPLLRLVRTARKEWSRLDRGSVDAQSSVISQFTSILPSFNATSLRTLYPEIDRGLNNLETSLLEAMGETDALEMVGRLAAVHEAGRQFMRELSRLAANPVERIEQAARGQFANVAGDIQAHIRGYEEKAKNFVDALKVTKEQISQELATYLAEELPWVEIDTLLRISKSGEAIFDLSTKALGELRKVDVDLTAIIERFKAGELAPSAALTEVAGEFIDGATNTATSTEDGLRSPSIAQKFVDLFKGYTQADRDVVAAAVAAYRKRLVLAKANVGDWLNGDKPPAEWATWLAQARTILDLVALVRDLVNSNRPERTFALLVQLGRDYLAVELNAFRTDVENKIKAQTAQLNAWTNEVLGRLVIVATGTAAAKAPISPTLPAIVVASCVAQLPAIDKGQAAAVATAIDTLSPEHFLKGFARSVADTFKLEEDLTTAQGKLPADPTANSIRSTIADFKRALSSYRKLFCEVAAVVGRAQAAHAELTTLSQGQGNPPVMTPGAMIAVADRLRILAKEIEQGLLRIRTHAREVSDLLGNHLPVILGAAAGGAFAAAFGDDLKEALKRWDISAALALRTALNTLFRWVNVVATIATKDAGDILTLAATALHEIIPGGLDPERKNLAVSLEQLDDICGERARIIANLVLPTPPADETVAQLLEANLENTTIKVRELLNGAGSIASTDEIETALQQISQNYVLLLDRAKGLPESLAGEAFNEPVRTLLNAVSNAYEKITVLRNEIVGDAAQHRIAGPAITRAMVIKPLSGPCDPLKPDCDKLTEERDAIKALAKENKPVTTNRKELRAFCDSISGGRSAVETIFDNVQKIWDDISRGELASLVDIAALRDQVEELISELVPKSRTLSYALDFDFDGDKIARLTGGIFTPKTPSRFQLAMTATINLLTADAQMNAKGRIGPFDIQLIGNVFDAVTLIFDGVDFGFEMGGSPRFDVQYRDFRIGKKLEFVKQLQSYMTPSKDGSGFFIEPMRGRPGILAGYGINLGTIQLGGIAFSNVLLNAAAELAFDGEAALFRFALGRALAPFLISVPPYGGGGFVAIYADAQGFRGFEASFEFGGVADFSTGPLVAQGRLTSGFFVRSMQVEVAGKRRTLTDIYGTFFVGGDASIWIFSFYASLYVRLGMKDGGEMEGEATFTFSFSMGIVDYDFQVTVSHNQQAFGSSGATNSIHNGSPGDSDALPGVDRTLITRSTAQSTPASTKSTAPNVFANTTPLGEATVADYLSYFDPTLIDQEAHK